jgi:AbrB family looped-hinge helix DNA binding protein
MGSKVTLDKAGRVVIPKPLRDEMRLNPGDTFDLESEGERITLRPVRPQAMLKKEFGVWVYQGEPTDQSIPDLIDQDRNRRIRSLQE